VTAPDTTLLIIAKQPLPGRVKTRLVPPCTHEQVSTLAEAALTDTLHTMLMVPARWRILVLVGAPAPPEHRPSPAITTTFPITKPSPAELPSACGEALRKIQVRDVTGFSAPTGRFAGRDACS
jgi:hypothetical protein